MTVSDIVWLVIESVFLFAMLYLFYKINIDSFKEWRARRKMSQLEAIDAALKARGEELNAAQKTIDNLRYLEDITYKQNRQLKVRNDDLVAKLQNLVDENAAQKIQIIEDKESIERLRRLYDGCYDERQVLKDKVEKLSGENSELSKISKTAEERVKTLDSLYMSDYRNGKKLEEKIKELNQKLEQKNIVSETEKPQNNNTINSEDVKVSKRSKKG